MSSRSPKRSKQGTDQEKLVSRRKKAFQLAWYGLGIAGAVALVAVVGTQMVQRGDQMQQEIEQSRQADSDDSSPSPGAVEEERVGKYRDDADLCTVVGDDTFTEAVGVAPDDYKKEYVPRDEFHSTTMKCTIKKSVKEHDRNYVSVVIHVEQFVDNESATEYYETISRNLSNPSSVSDMGLEESTLADSGAADDHEFDSLFALDDNLVASIYVNESYRKAAIELTDELRRDLLTEYAQSVFDGLRDA